MRAAQRINRAQKEEQPYSLPAVKPRPTARPLDDMDEVFSPLRTDAPRLSNLDLGQQDLPSSKETFAGESAGLVLLPAPDHSDSLQSQSHERPARRLFARQMSTVSRHQRNAALTPPSPRSLRQSYPATRLEPRSLRFAAPVPPSACVISLSLERSLLPLPLVRRLLPELPPRP